MKFSKSFMEIKINAQQTMWYSSFSREYVLFGPENATMMKRFRQDIEHHVRDPYMSEQMIRTLLKKKIILEDGDKEVTSLQVVKPYIEAHMNISLEELNMARFAETICSVSRYVSKLTITWYGGAPMELIHLSNHLSQQTHKMCHEHNCVYESAIQTDGYLLEPFAIKKIRDAGMHYVQCTLESGTKPEDLSSILEQGMKIRLRINVNSAGYRNADYILQEIPQEYRQNITIHYCNTFQHGEEKNVYKSYMNALQMGYAYGNRTHCFEIEGAKTSYSELELGKAIRTFIEKSCRCDPMRDGMKIQDKALLDYYADQFYCGLQTKMDSRRFRVWGMA